MSERPTALVTGGSTGIGAAICRELLDRGYRVVTCARRAPDVAHDDLIAERVDLADPAATAEMAARVAAEHRITTVVHNAGAVREALLPDVGVEDLTTLAHLHLTAAMLLVQANLGTMRDAGFGRIVLVGSRAALGLARRTAYSATKAGMIGMSRTWALELGPYGITSNVVAPGPIEETEMFHEVLPVGDPRIEKARGAIPVRRFGRPEDVARAVAFLAAPENGFITGQTLFVCGGTSVGSIAY